MGGQRNDGHAVQQRDAGEEHPDCQRTAAKRFGVAVEPLVVVERQHETVEGAQVERDELAGAYFQLSARQTDHGWFGLSGATTIR